MHEKDEVEVFSKTIICQGKMNMKRNDFDDDAFDFISYSRQNPLFDFQLTIYQSWSKVILQLRKAFFDKHPPFLFADEIF